MKLNIFLKLGGFAFSFLIISCSGGNTKVTKSYDDLDSTTIRKIYDEILIKGQAYENLKVLCKEIGSRLSGSEGAEKAVDWTYELMKGYGFDTVYKQAVMVPHWVRGNKEFAYFQSGFATQEVPVTALGGSIATTKEGITAGIIEVQNFEQLKKMDPSKVKGNIVFFNRPMDAKQIETFKAYGGCVDQRGSGAAEAAKMGAVATIVRSMNLRLDDYPHAGGMSYQEGVKKVPAAAISTNGAEALSKAIKENSDTKFHLILSCKTLPDVESYNVIAELRGTEFPDEFMVVGGHLDSWDKGEGAHDDGAGVVQSIEVLRIFKKLGIKPKRSLRTVLFMNEENGAKGAYAYADIAKKSNEKHIAAIESDRGGFAPRGFSVQGNAQEVAHIKQWSGLLKPYFLEKIEAGFGGVDIGPLKEQGTMLIGYYPDPQRYFIHHHADTDVFEAVDERELELGAASITSLFYLLDRYGVPQKNLNVQ
jgi:carboxypeptidase Q